MINLCLIPPTVTQTIHNPGHPNQIDTLYYMDRNVQFSTQTTCLHMTPATFH